ncbi:MAG TPA: alpha-1,4-glucan--maltose-1-phosphate maltosyltransferase [Candidatus Binataceae bacterium]|nr:alpha-1,4-glucan--maltose-1-phosphate maltosyltransferase [Candidatus Binataceae bacterium]
MALFLLKELMDSEMRTKKMKLDSTGIKPQARTPVSSRELETVAQAIERHIIEAVSPAVDCGRYPAKRVVGEPCIVEADIFRDGHVIIRSVIKWRRKDAALFAEVPMRPLDNDRWRGSFPLNENTRYVFTIEAWSDTYATWAADFVKKVTAGRNVASDLEEGIAILRGNADHLSGSDRNLVIQTADQFAALMRTDPEQAAPYANNPALIEVLARAGKRDEPSQCAKLFEVIADRPKARFGSWYEMFPRSQGTVPGQPSTLREAERRLPDIHAMGFDVLYLAPIHPIGMTNRKGRNNSLSADGTSPGSPWAIGSPAGGHMAVEPSLGTLADFDHFVAAAREHRLEVALDFAIQCSPDHPWVKDHPAWFNHRPDGSIKYAENPPKEYQDIYPVNFNTRDRDNLLAELRRTVEFWINHGVRIFRVDNPHTKPLYFWEWLIGTIQASYPDTIFLAEAFTRPKMMKALAKAGFTQSYTYFTWRNTKAELTEYLTELTQTPMADYFRPNFFANTPDILAGILQGGGAASFKLRAVLAATLSPSWGIYSGFELCENENVPGSEEYLASEKYEIRARDWSASGNIKSFIALLNEIRQNNRALQRFGNLMFLPADNDQILFYRKASAEGDDVLLIAVNLDPLQPQACTVTVPSSVVGVKTGQRYEVTDLLTGASYNWGDYNYVRLDPSVQPAHILRVAKQI